MDGKTEGVDYELAHNGSEYVIRIRNISSAELNDDFTITYTSNGKSGTVYNQDINSRIGNISGDILYLDPPYNARQYCANYHVLETIARYDNPVLKGKIGLRDNSNQKSLFCSKKTVTKVFDDLIANADFKYIFLSYNYSLFYFGINML